MRYYIFALLTIYSIKGAFAYQWDAKLFKETLYTIYDMAPNVGKSDADQLFQDIESFIANRSDTLKSSSESSKPAARKRYIIQLDKNLSEESRKRIDSLINGLNATVRHQLNSVFDGMTISSDIELPRELLEKIPHISLFEKDQKLVTTQVQPLDGRLWGLDLMDQTSPKLSGQYVFDTTGKGVHIYIVDSGIDVNHPELKGRADTVYIANSLNGDSRDCTGHGTHVAGIAAGTNVGVAKEAFVHAIRIIDCAQSSSNSALIAALEWVAANAQKPAVLSMSLGPTQNADGSYTRSQSVDAAIMALKQSGIFVVVAAGNDNSDGCQGSPTGSAGAIAVGATDQSRNKAWFSNYGQCVQIFAPGDTIFSAIPGGKYGTKWGTSQATPFVSGMAALYLQKNPQASPEQVLNGLQAAALVNTVAEAKNSQNLFLQSISVPLPSSSGYSQKFVDLFPLPGMTIDEFFKFSSSLLRGLVIAAIVVGLLLVALLTSCCLLRHKRQKRLRKADLRMMSQTNLAESQPHINGK